MSQKNKPITKSDRLQSLIWLIGIAILFLTDDWWPGILILVGVSVLAEYLIRRPASPAAEIAPTPEPAPLAAPVVPAEAVPPASPAVPEETPPAWRRMDLLPDTCPACGAKVRSDEVRWVSEQSAQCAYCGTTLPHQA